MNESTQETIHRIRKLFVELCFDKELESQMPEDVRAQMNAANIKALDEIFKHYDPATQSYIDTLFSDKRAWEALALVCTLCASTQKMIEIAIMSEIIDQTMVSALAHTTPEGNA